MNNDIKKIKYIFRKKNKEKQKMPDYSNGKIYTIRSYQTEEFYIGSTIQSLPVRFGGHKRKYKLWLNTQKSYTSSYEILKYDDNYIELLELYSCSCKEELRRREGELIRLHNCVNKSIAGRTHKEYREENKEKIKEYKEKYHQENKEKLKEYYQEYREENKEKIKEYREKNKEKQKEYREKNKEKQKEYTKKNKEKKKEYNKKYYQKKLFIE